MQGGIAWRGRQKLADLFMCLPMRQNMHEITSHNAGRHSLLLKGVCSTCVNGSWSFWSNKLVNPYAYRHCLLMQTRLRQQGETAQMQE